MNIIGDKLARLEKDISLCQDVVDFLTGRSGNPKYLKYFKDELEHHLYEFEKLSQQHSQN